MTHSLRLELRVPPDWSRIEDVRTAVDLCVRSVCADPDRREALSMTAVELTENAIKYGRADDNLVTVTLYDKNGDIVVEVSNPLAPEQDGEQVARRIAWIESFPSAADAYQAAMLQVGAEGRDGVSGLGLARIAYEGGCRLTSSMQNGVMTVRAHHSMRD